MKRLIALWILLIGMPVLAIDQIELLITVTNHAVTGDTLVINSTTRTWTNAHSSSTIQTNSAAGAGPTKTNLFYNLAAYYLPENPSCSTTNTNTIRMIFNAGTAVTASQTGDWCEFTYTTNVITKVWTVRVPMTVEANTNQTNFASMLVGGIGKATNRFLAAWECMTNFAALAGQNQFIGTNNLGTGGGWHSPSITNATLLSGILGNLTNGVATNTILVSPTLSNGVAYSGFSSVGSGINSEQIGTSATASGGRSVAFGYYAQATATNTIAIGASASATASGDVVIGRASEGGGGDSLCLGNLSAASKTNGVVIGNNSLNDYTNSIAIGNYVTNTTKDQVMLGTASHTVTIPGQIQPTGTITNAVMTGTNKFGTGSGLYCALSFPVYAITTMAATDNEINPSNAVYLKLSGAGENFDLEGLEGGFDGRVLLVQNSEVYSMLVENECGGAAAANRILTGTGADITLTNNPKSLTLIYDAGASRWVIRDHTN